LLRSDTPERIVRLLKEGLIQLTVPRNILSKANLRPTDTFKLTPEGARRIEAAVQAEYADVSKVMVEHGRAAGEDEKSEMAEGYLDYLDSQNQAKIGTPNPLYRDELDRLFNSSSNATTTE